jgi:hypothetical protein
MGRVERLIEGNGQMAQSSLSCSPFPRERAASRNKVLVSLNHCDWLMSFRDGSGLGRTGWENVMPRIHVFNVRRMHWYWRTQEHFRSKVIVGYHSTTTLSYA